MFGGRAARLGLEAGQERHGVLRRDADDFADFDITGAYGRRIVGGVRAAESQQKQSQRRAAASVLRCMV
jgi:hypothetical protein